MTLIPSDPHSKFGATLLATSLGFLLTGCVSLSEELAPEPAPVTVEEPDAEPEESEDDAGKAEFAIATVQERYEAECLLPLGGKPQYRYEADPGGTMREGFVFVSIGGDVLQFAVGVNENSGSFLAVPHNEITLEKLAEAGC